MMIQESLPLSKSALKLKGEMDEFLREKSITDIAYIGHEELVRFVEGWENLPEDRGH